MLRKEPVLGLLGLGLKPTTSTLSYISERRESGCGLCVVNRGRGGEDQSVLDGDERKRSGGKEEFTSS